MKQIPQETLAECLDLLEQGLSVEQILSRFPEESAALRPFLDTAVQLSRLAHAPTLAASRQSREAVLQEVEALRDSRSFGAPLWLWLRQALAPAVAFAVLLLAFAVALPQISASALPGDSLYGGKRLVERAQLFLAPGPQRTTLLARFNEERIREVEALLNSGREAEVQFEGDIREIEANHWTVAGIRINLGEDTTIEGEPWPAGQALVQGRTQGGRLLATRLVVFGEPPPPPEPEPTPTMTVTPTATATPSPTPAAATISPTPADTLEPVPSLTPTPPVSTSTPPAPSPTGDDGGTENDNGDDGDKDDNDDNQNDGGGDDNGNENDGGDANENDDDDANENDGGDANENDDDNMNDGGDDRDNENDDNDANENEDNGNEGDDD